MTLALSSVNLLPLGTSLPVSCGRWVGVVWWESGAGAQGCSSRTGSCTGHLDSWFKKPLYLHKTINLSPATNQVGQRVAQRMKDKCFHWASENNASVLRKRIYITAPKEQNVGQNKSDKRKRSWTWIRGQEFPIK